MRALVARIEATLAEVALPRVVKTAVTGNTVLIARSADGVAEAQPRTVAVAALAIFVVVAWTFRSAGLGLARHDPEPGARGNLLRHARRGARAALAARPA